MPFIFFPTFPESSLFDSSLIYLYITANRAAISHTVYATQTSHACSQSGDVINNGTFVKNIFKIRNMDLNDLQTSESHNKISISELTILINSDILFKPGFFVWKIRSFL